MQLLKKYAVFSKVSITDATEHYHLKGIFYTSPDAKATDHNYYYINKHLAYAMTPKNTDAAEKQDEQAAKDWNALMLFYHQPHLQKEGIGKWLPYELGLLALDAIDFEKGCYLGQEIIARMHYRSKRHFEIHLATLSCKETPLYEEVMDANNHLVGAIISAVPLHSSRYLVLLSIKDGIYQEPLFLSKGERYDIELITNLVE
jgi:folate-binding protein YgfZ